MTKGSGRCSPGHGAAFPAESRVQIFGIFNISAKEALWSFFYLKMQTKPGKVSPTQGHKLRSEQCKILSEVSNSRQVLLLLLSLRHYFSEVTHGMNSFLFTCTGELCLG